MPTVPAAELNELFNLTAADRSASTESIDTEQVGDAVRNLDIAIDVLQATLPEEARTVHTAGSLDHAIAELDIALDVVTTNEPINRAEGDDAQADLELEAADSYEQAIEYLEIIDENNDAAEAEGLLAE